MEEVLKVDKEKTLRCLEKYFDRYRHEVLSFRRLTLYLDKLKVKIINQKAINFMDKDLLDQYEKKLIFEVCRTVQGIGETKAGFIAEYFGDFQDFLKADEASLLNIVNSRGRAILDKDKAEGMMSVKGEIVNGLPIIETWTHFLSKVFIRNQVAALEAMEFENLDINPLLAKALALETPVDIIQFNIYQSVTRSVVTSWGSMVERMLKYSGCELDSIKFGIKGREPDLIKKKSGETHCLQIKSGPNTMNVDMIESLNEVIEKVEKKGYIGWLGMTYGRKNRISQQILGNFKDADTKTKIGRELWDFISESKDYHKKVIDIIDSATKQELDKCFIDLIEDKVKSFVKAWENKYSGKPLNDILEDYI